MASGSPCTSTSTAPQKHLPLCVVIMLVSPCLRRGLEPRVQGHRLTRPRAEQNDLAFALLDAASRSAAGSDRECPRTTRRPACLIKRPELLTTLEKRRIAPT